MESTTTFIIIDDNVIDILTHKIVLRAKLNDPIIIDFICPQKALHHIKENYSKKSNTKTILLLDLNMPVMSGWGFLEHFEKMDRKIKDQIKIFIVTFCVNPKSEELAVLNPNVELFISKPLNTEKFSQVVDFIQPIK